MNKLLKALIVSATICVASKASVTFNGVAFLNVPSIAAGDVAYFIIDVNNTGFENITFNIGEDLTTAAAYGDYFLLGSKIATAAGDNVILSGAFANTALSDGITTNDRFAAIVFSNSSTSAQAPDTYTIWTDPTWVIPADGSTLSYQGTPTGANFKQLGAASAPIFTGVIAIPEPSSFAALAGLVVVGAVATRRRRSA